MHSTPQILLPKLHSIIKLQKSSAFTKPFIISSSLPLLHITMQTKNMFLHLIKASPLINPKTPQCVKILKYTHRYKQFQAQLLIRINSQKFKCTSPLKHPLSKIFRCT